MRLVPMHSGGSSGSSLGTNSCHTCKPYARAMRSSVSSWVGF